MLDDNRNAVADARVIFEVVDGRGRLSQRGNGRAIAVQTDAQGYARAAYTPMSVSSTVRAEARRVSRTVEFTITTGSAPPPSDTTPTPSDDDVTPSREINPKVHLDASERPSILWVDGGAIYALIGAKAERFAPSVDNALNITIGAGKVYWTAQTGRSSGTVNSANLDGSGMTEVAESRFSIPTGIAIDATNKHLYWTNSSGNLKRATLDGKRIQNALQNLQDPMDLALDGGNAYWTQGDGKVRFVNLQGTKNLRNISTGTDPAMSLTIAGGKVYWTEKTGDSSGTVNSANLDGSGVTEIYASPVQCPNGHRRRFRTQ